MTAPALPRPNLDTLRADLDAADAAYTLAVQTASRSGTWVFVQAAAQAVHQARNALTTAEQDQT